MNRIIITIEGPRPGTPEGNKSGVAIDVQNLSSEQYIQQLGEALQAILRHEARKNKYYLAGPELIKRIEEKE